MPDSRPAQGNSFSILLLILPTLALALLWYEGGLHLPVNQLAFLAAATPVVGLCFLGCWWLGFHGVRHDRTLLMVGAFLGLFWMIAMLPLAGWLNQAGDDSAPREEIRAVLKTQVGHGGARSRSTPACHVWLDAPLEGVGTLAIRRDYCDLIRPGEDGILMTVKAGRFGMAWLQDYQVIRDIRGWRARMGS